MLSEVFDPFTGKLKETPDLGVLKGVRNVLRLFKKTLLTDEGEALLHLQAVEEFYQCDVRASRVVIPDRHGHLIGRVCKSILNTLNSKDVQNAKYKHGPGAVKEGYKANEKFSALYEAIESDRFDLDRYGLSSPNHAWSIYGPRNVREGIVSELDDRTGIRRDSTESLGCSKTSGLIHGKERPRIGRSNHGSRGFSNPSGRDDTPRGAATCLVVKELAIQDEASRSSAKLISVAKNSSARRTITVEPMLKQYVQQGLNILLRESISECKILGNCIALSDQSKNQQLALEGSQYGNWATIDLKSASDLMSLKLVESVFRHHAEFLQHMIDCRSPYVICEGRTPLNLGKFAGMGNALTFPVQSICFAVIGIASILDVWGLSPTYRNLVRASRCIRVYGDDIVIRSEYAHQCVNWLHDVGLQVNVKKSFLEGNFKESCGVEAFRGVDITPLYIKHHPEQSSKSSPSIIAGFVSLSNSFWMEGLYEASTWLKNVVESTLGRQLPLVSRDSGLLGWFSRQDAMMPHKWCRHTQQFLTRSVALIPLKRRDRLDGYAALLKCLSSTQESVIDEKRKRCWFPEPMALDPNHLVQSTVRYKTRIATRWVPTRVGTD
jgi:hypothetical protein